MSIQKFTLPDEQHQADLVIDNLLHAGTPHFVWYDIELTWVYTGNDIPQDVGSES